MIITEKNGLDLSAINPKNGSKFSPNLYKWLSKKSSPHRAWSSRVYKDKDGILWIGILEKRELIGSMLIGVLCNGTKEGTAAWQKIDAVEIKDFWTRYREIGRCAIDAEHSMYFIGDDSRWSINGDSRSCLWCGNANQVMKRWTETLARTAWVKL